MLSLQRPTLAPLTASPNVASLKTKVPNPYRKFYSVMLAVMLTLCTLLICPNPSFADSATLVAATPIATTAATPADSQVKPQTNSTHNGIADEKVARFSQAYLQVLQLLSDRAPDLAAAKSADEAAIVQQAIEAEAVALIQESGLTLPEYMQILEVASQDATFRDQVLGRLDKSVEN